MGLCRVIEVVLVIFNSVVLIIRCFIDRRIVDFLTYGFFMRSRVCFNLGRFRLLGIYRWV